LLVVVGGVDLGGLVTGGVVGVGAGGVTGAARVTGGDADLLND
jgi:hypothetical protein